jgi:hypothetical protein
LIPQQMGHDGSDHGGEAHEQIAIKVDGKWRLTLRNRRFIRELDHRKTGLGNHAPMPHTTTPHMSGQGRMRHYKVTPPSWSPLPPTSITPPETADKLPRDTEMPTAEVLLPPRMITVLTSITARKKTRYVVSPSLRPH